MVKHDLQKTCWGCIEFGNLAVNSPVHFRIMIVVLPPLSKHFSLLCYSPQNATGQEAPSEGSHIRVGGAPVTCITLVNENVWCGCGNNVVILDGR